VGSNLMEEMVLPAQLTRNSSRVAPFVERT
jgi:hypothetical protein